MKCTSPLKGWKSREISESGKRKLVFRLSEGYADMPFEVSCGQCIGCKLERSRQWAIRCMHEASLYGDNCSLTLTYDDDHMPEGATLVKRDFQLFMKKLRREYEPRQIRYFMAGEYGDTNLRPHFHVLLFNVDFCDKKYLKKSPSGYDLFISVSLNHIWGNGFVLIGSLTFDSAAYVSRYCTKALTSSGDFTRINFNSDTGQYYEVENEFSTMSTGGRGKKGGIGKEWFDKFALDTYKDDTVICNGKAVRPPKYYDDLFEKLDKDKHDVVKYKRLRSMDKLDPSESSFERLQVKDKIMRASVAQLKRPL